MLRIKETEWQKFCENAEKLGFKKKVKYYANDEISVNIDTRYCLVNNIGYSPYGESNSNKNMYNTQRFYIGNVLLDLIEQGYVEKC